MRRLCWVVVLLSAALGRVWAQAPTDHVLFKDAFEDNSNNWRLPNSSRVQSQISGGKLQIQHNIRGYGNVYRQQIFISPNEDWYMEMKIRSTLGNQNAFYGFVFGKANNADKSYAHYFYVTPSGRFAVLRAYRDKLIREKNWTLNKAIKGHGKWNILGIKKAGQKITYLVNGQEVFQGPYRKAYGTLQGISVGAPLSVEVDYWAVFHPPAPIQTVQDPKVPDNKKNLGRAINSKHSDYAPVISPDGQTLYFDRAGHPENTGPDREQDVWYSERQADGSWSPAQNIGPPINNAGINAVISVGADGKSLLIEGTYNKDGSHKSNAFSLTQRRSKKEDFPMPHDIRIRDFENLDENTSASMSTDGRILVMSLEKPGNRGMKDIYVSFKGRNGFWSKPRNLGPDINTFASEFGPFLAPDNKTLYFVSYGYPGYGMADIFVSRRKDDSWKRWTEPKNLGPSVNTADWDAYLSIPVDGSHAYMSSTYNSRGRLDVVQIKLPESARPEPVTILKGHVLNEKTGKALKQPVSVALTNLETNDTLSTATANPSNGKYEMILPYGQNYAVVANAEGYYAFTEHVKNSKIDPQHHELQKDLMLSPIEPGEEVVLGNVFFDHNKTDLKHESYHELDRLATMLKQNPRLKIQISGFTDGSATYRRNYALAHQRVKSIIDYLAKKGIEEQRMINGGWEKVTGVDTEGAKHRKDNTTLGKFKILDPEEDQAKEDGDK